MSRTFRLHFWAPSDCSDDEARTSLREQATSWAEAEPNITACRVISVDRPDPERPHWWEATVVVDLREQVVEQPTLWGAA